MSRSLKLTPDTANASCVGKSVPEISDFAVMEPTNNPLVALQLAIFQLEEEKRNLATQIGQYQHRLFQAFQVEAQGKSLLLLNDSLKEQLCGVRVKLHNEQTMNSQLREMIGNLE